MKKHSRMNFPSNIQLKWEFSKTNAMSPTFPMPPAISENWQVPGCQRRCYRQHLWGHFSTLDLFGALELPGFQRWVVDCHPPETCRSTAPAKRHWGSSAAPVWGRGDPSLGGFEDQRQGVKPPWDRADLPGDVRPRTAG